MTSGSFLLRALFRPRLFSLGTPCSHFVRPSSPSCTGSQRALIRASRLPLANLTASSWMGNKPTRGNMESSAVKEAPKPEVQFTEEELKQRLTEEEYDVTQNKGTERAFTGRYLDVKEDGVFNCVVCGSELFTTNKKYNSGSGWPSFTDVSKNGTVINVLDTSHGMTRVEVICGKCGAHLGHVFEDGPKEDTGMRYCINGAALKFKPK